MRSDAFGAIYVSTTEASFIEKSNDPEALPPKMPPRPFQAENPPQTLPATTNTITSVCRSVTALAGVNTIETLPELEKEVVPSTPEELLVVRPFELFCDMFDA